MTHEVVWDGTPHHRHGKYIFAPAEVTRPAPLLVDVERLAPLGRVQVLRRRARDLRDEPLKLQIYKLFLLRNMAIADLVAHFKNSHSQSKVYGAVSALRTSRHIHVIGREMRARANGIGPMSRDVYGPTLVTQELQL